MGLLQLSHLVEVDTEYEIKEHHARLLKDHEYLTRVKEFFSVLSKKTAKSSAASTIDKHLKTMDGVLVWNDLRRITTLVETRRLALLLR